ncbi:MAG: Phosphoglycerate kinase Pgk [Candidatus Amesbacteria bacterium GW2011_GWA2_47_11b]|uniref:Phosphoglycerate kinase n=1 Tax=Candidatus Amesbacteria bacterium GW2011_GWA2_47_11b TaxID=1618358 RepID=A0A0G1RL82_9BACT|nr:MAG: Phosphoglycerate kinase Pgk [Candidatus Amesbacteria bacterium GW2011_GWA2_47_11b]
MKLRTLEETDIYQKTVLYRSAYDIGVKQIAGGDYVVKDDSRIRASLKTLEYLINNECKIVVLTYVKRPDGKIVESLRTSPHAKSLSALLGKPVRKMDDCIGDEVRKAISDLKAGEVVMLENVRFHPEEMIDDDKFAKELTYGCDLVVFDGFPQAHRAHASTTGILRHLPNCAGFYLESEVAALSRLTSAPQKPFTIIIGGEKISDKIDAINNLYDVADAILVGGGVANVFMKAKGIDVGSSFVEDVFVDLVRTPTEPKFL